MIYNQWFYELTKRLGLVNLNVAVGTAPSVLSTGAARTPQAGSYFWKLTTVSADGTTSAVLTSAKDRNGTTVSGLAGITLRDGVSLLYPLSEFTLTSGTVIAYQAPSLNIEKEQQ